MQSAPAPSLAETLGYIALYIGSGVAATGLCLWVVGTFGGAGWLLYPITVFFIGTRFRAMGNMIHEACHGMLVRGKRKNMVLGHLLAIFDFTELHAYTEEHFAHHRHLGDDERDLDFKPRRRFGFGERQRNFIWTHYLRPLTLFHVPVFVRPVFISRRDSWQVAIGRGVFLGLLAALGFWVGWTPFVLFYVVPYLTAYQVIRYWSDAVDHAGIISSQDEFHRSRNHFMPFAWMNRIAFPRNDELHLTHHLFPAVPVKMQPAVHAVLMQDPDYSGREYGIGRIHREQVSPSAA